MDLITVIVPVYMAEKYLDRCIFSICHQTYKNIKLILVDDGSTDQSPYICECWAKKDSRVRVIHQKNQGVSVARNKGIENTHGDYIIMLDSDDYLCLSMIEIMYKVMKENVADLVVCGFEKGNEDKFEFSNCEQPQVELINGEHALKRIYESDEKALQYAAPWAKLYRKELFNGLRYPVGKIFEDIYVTHEILYRCDKIAVVTQKMVYYYQHADSIMNRKFHVGKLDYLEALKNRVLFFKTNHLLELESIAYDEYLHSLIWEYSRARDLINNKEAMNDIVFRYRSIYKKGYSSKRYLDESRIFLYTFFVDPELIILYWKIKSRFKRWFQKD